jgi:hypothetical protein
LALMGSAFGQAAMTFDDFKKLSPEQQNKLIQQAPPASQWDLYVWRARLNMGEYLWRHLELKRLILARGLSGLEGVFDEQTNIIDIFRKQKEAAAKKSGLSGRALDAIVKPNDAKALASRFQRDDDLEMVAKLAPTPKAMELNKKADAIAEELWKRLDPGNGTIPVVKQEDITSVNKTADEIRTEMKRLPQWTEQQVDAAIAALPKDDPGLIP